MDLNARYKQQLEFYNYVEKQRENCIDLTNDSSDHIKSLANILFNKSIKDLGLNGLLVDDMTEPADIFCMLVELVLYGIDILTNTTSNIFELDDPNCELIGTVNKYLKTTGFYMEINEDFVEDNIVCLYRDRNDYYFEILGKPPFYLCINDGWYVGNYRMAQNINFKFTKNTDLAKFKAFFVTHNKKIFVITFKYVLNNQI